MSRPYTNVQSRVKSMNYVVGIYRYHRQLMKYLLFCLKDSPINRRNSNRHHHLDLNWNVDSLRVTSILLNNSTTPFIFRGTSLTHLLTPKSGTPSPSYSDQVPTIQRHTQVPCLPVQSQVILLPQKTTLPT